ncbi:hypothetical protein SAMN05444422_111110 [Halobiforma haloterrestris]|uniref:Restriction endonuclease n=1 Tax=Natronobacterium haloterrestre TaxID=148448 RepID=A0A1I1KGU4_NATHA|nr:hypothetical protein [Halobiforma haloterrestris]SFC59765.1 hypothetical protein SAMN05444422_111110 [Halobiforma haloterrestris]
MSSDGPPREETEGRGNGDGRWLEYQLEQAMRRWGYSAATRVSVYGLEIDVAAQRKEKRDRPTDWLLAECKDWDSRLVTEDELFRLCMLAFTCVAMPVLCHTTELTERAEEIARKWEVRVLTLEDLHRGDLPAPNALGPSDDLFEYRYRMTGREQRGRLPFVFHDKPNSQFTYVPGYEPSGRTHEYRPIEDDEGEENTGGGE